MLKHTLLFISLIGTSLSYSLSAQEATDSVSSSINLEEFVVVGERAWIEGNKAIFIPDKSEKNLSNSPATLVEQMHIPTVIVRGEQIKSLSGQDIPIFINGEPAEGIDLSTFWPKQAYRVEHIFNPTDPKYRNAREVINFVMTEYEVGGVTKISANQYIPNNGRYNIASKLVYKKMTYGVTVNGGYSRDHRSTYTGEEDYKDVYFNGDFHDVIAHRFKGHSYSRSENVAAALSARYLTDKTNISHTVGLSYNHNPGSGSENLDYWDGALFDSHSSMSRNSSHSLSPQVQGNYFVQLASNLSVGGGWGYSHSHTNTFSRYEADGKVPILNNARGDTDSGTLGLFMSYVPRQNLGFGFNANSSMDRFDTEYTGSANARNLQWSGYTSASVTVQWLPLQRLYLRLAPGIIANYWHLFGSKICHDVQPTAEAFINYTFSQRFSMNGMVMYSRYAPKASQTGDVMLRESELIWLAPNEELKSNSRWDFNVSATWVPVSFFYASLTASYNRWLNEFITTYSQASKEDGGVIKTFANSKPFELWNFQGNFSLSLLRNKLNLWLNPELRVTKAHGYYAGTFTHFRMRGGLSYNFRNFQAGVTYFGTEKGLDNGGMNRYYSGDSWDFYLRYGTGDLYMTFTVADVFHTHSKSWNTTDAGIYYNHYDYSKTGRQLRISVSYTFGYGKKVDKDIDISAPSEAKSAILGAE